jgi:hypothetical protein
MSGGEDELVTRALAVAFALAAVLLLFWPERSR